MATKRRQQPPTHFQVEAQRSPDNLELFEKLVDRLLRKDSIPTPKLFCDGKDIDDHLRNVNRYLLATTTTDEAVKTAVLLNSLDEDVQLVLFSQPAFQAHADDFIWMSDKLRDLYAVKRSPVSPPANLLSLK